MKEGRRIQGESVGLYYFGLKPIAGVQKAQEGGIGFLVGKEGGEALIHHQGFQAQLQLTLFRKIGEAIAGAAAGKEPLRLLHILYRPDAHAQGSRLLPVFFQLN